MLTHDEAFLADIVENPEDDGPRLIYADWLDDHGDPARAEFIRVQCELARMEGDDPRRPTLARRECQLLGMHQGEWTKGFPEWVHDRRFHRGFVNSVNCSSGNNFLTKGQELLANHPITEVWLSGKEAHLRTVAERSYLARVRHLGIFDAHPRGLTVLVASPFATNIRGLHLQRLHVPSYRERLGDFVPILELPHLARITRLSLCFTAIDLQEIRQFIDLGVLQRLNSLTLDCPHLRDATARVLAGIKDISGLHTLRLRGSRGLSDACARYLASSPHLAELRRLSLFAAARITIAGVNALAASPYLRNLTDLDLRYTRITRFGVKALIESPNLPRLSRLILSGTPAAGQAASVEASPWHSCPPDEHPGVLWVAEVRGL